MNTILVDQDIEGQVLILWGSLAAEGWLDLVPSNWSRLRKWAYPQTAVIERCGGSHKPTS